MVLPSPLIQAITRLSVWITVDGIAALRLGHLAVTVVTGIAAVIAITVSDPHQAGNACLPFPKGVVAPAAMRARRVVAFTSAAKAAATLAGGVAIMLAADLAQRVARGTGLDLILVACRFAAASLEHVSTRGNLLFESSCSRNI